MQRQQERPIAECATAGAGRASRAESLLGRLANLFARVVQALVVGAGLILLVMLGSDLQSNASVGFVLVIILWSVFAVLGIAVHELGHYVAACMMGMRVTSMQIWRFEFAPQRRGMRVRWSSRPGLHGTSGHVMAFADPSRSTRAAHLVMTTGGVAANFAAAGACGLVGVLGTGAIPTLCLMFATVNLILGLMNLVPHHGKVCNDGYLLVLLLRRRMPEMFQHPHLRLIRLTLFGRTADQLPEEDLAAMESGPFPGLLVALWYRLKARQIRGDWSGTAAMQHSLDMLLGGLPREACARAQPLIDCVRTEIAFSTAMHERASGALVEGLMPEASAWYEPHLWPRCLAVKAAIEGDLAACRRWLDQVSALAENAIDASLPASERMIRASIANAFPGADASLPE